MKRIHIVGGKNSGKTTLVVELVRTMTERGYKVGTIKHTHHHHELDAPGKDSHQHRLAGSSAVGILSPGMNAIFWPQANEPNKVASYDLFDSMMQQCDLVIVEGDSQAEAMKVEVYRAENGNPPVALTENSVQAVVTDDPIDVSVPVWQRSDLETLVKNVELLLNLEQAK